MAFTYAGSDRDLNIRATVTLSTGTVKSFDASTIFSYSIDEDCSNSGFALGCAPSASYSLTLSNQGHTLSALALIGAIVNVDIAIKVGNSYVWSDFGVWIVDKVSLSNQSSSAELTGYDALYKGFDGKFSDDTTNYPRTILSLAQSVCTAVGVTLKSDSFLNSGVSIASMPKWEDDISHRSVVAYIAACAGGFARMTRDGLLEFVQYNAQETNSVSASAFFTFSITSPLYFNFNRIQVKMASDKDFTDYAIDDTIPASADNTIQVTDNPMFSAAIANSVKTALSGFVSYGCDLDWRGDPESLCGKKISVTDTDGLTYSFVVTEQSFDFSGSLRCSSSATIPDESSGSSAYSTASSAFTSDGKLNGGIIAASSIQVGRLAADSIETENLKAGCVTASKLDATTVSAQIITAVVAEIERISAGSITTAELYAGFGKIIKLAADEISAGHLTTDVLAAKLGEFVKLYADTAGIAYADIKDLVTGTAIITSGEADKLYIARLAVTDANIVSLAVGQLLVQGEDGNLYQLTVDDKGKVSTILRQIVDSDIADHTIDAGEKILSGSITADLLNVKEIFASSALVNAIKAANIDVADLFASEAVITKLNAWDIWSNEYMQLAVKKGELETYLRLTTDGIVIGKTNDPVRMVLTNNNLQIQENGVSLATFGASKLSIPRGEFTNALMLGNFAFSPQADGGLALLVR